MRDEELRLRLQALAVAGQVAPNPAAVAAVRRRLRRKVQGGVVVVLVGLLLAGVGVRLGSEAAHRRSVGPAPVIAPPAGPPAAVAPKTFVGQTGHGQFSLSADGSSVAFAHMTPARTGAIVGPSCHAETLVVRALASGNQRVWTIPPGVSLDGLQLSPDATQLAYLLRRDSAGLQPSLHLLPLTGTTSV